MTQPLLILLFFPAIILLAEKGNIKELEAQLKQRPKPELRDMEEALLVTVRKENDECLPHLILAGARGIDCALGLAIQLENIKAIAILLLCKAAIAGDSTAIHSLLFEPPKSINVPWYVPGVQEILSQGIIDMRWPITLSILEAKYKATKELLLKTNVNMSNKQVDWNNLKLNIFDSSWMYAIAPWVVYLNLANNQLKELPCEIFTATLLRRLDLSHNLLESISENIFSLPNLKHLSLSHNKLKKIPETSNWAAFLTYLDLSDNSLSTLPWSLQHSSIVNINLSGNQLITVVPKCLCCIHTLTTIDLSNTPIKSLPKEMENLQELKKVTIIISNTNITNPKKSIGKLHREMRGKTKVLGHSSKPYSHIKLVILCYSEKIKKIVLSELKGNFNLPLPEIDVFQWSSSKYFSNLKFQFNTWMLASPYSCRSIYPCFFTSEALYVIEWNLTVDLKIKIFRAYIDLLMRYIPLANIFVIAVLPEKIGGRGKKKFNIQEKLSTLFSEPSYQNLSYHGYMVSSKVKDGQGYLQQQLHDAAQKMSTSHKGEHQHIVGHQVPESYFSLIPKLETIQKVILEESALRTVLDEVDPYNKKELESMIGFLSEVGLLLHYDISDSKLNQYYFISPVWLYDTLLNVVSQVQEHHSVLFVTYSELCSLTKCRNKAITQALIQLMIHYAIVLPTGRDQYLITCFLPHSQPPTEALYCGLLRRHFAPKSRCLPVDLWSRLLSFIMSNLPEIIDNSELRKESMDNNFNTNDESADAAGNQEIQSSSVIGEAQSLTHSKKLFSRSLSLQASHHIQYSAGSLQRCASAPEEQSDSSKHSLNEPVTIDDFGIQIWDSGIIYNHEGVKFSIFLKPDSQEPTVEKRGIEICCSRDNYGTAIMARLCWLVQSYLEKDFSYLFSTETDPQKHELAQTVVCPICLKRNKAEPPSFSIEICTGAIQLREEHNCEYHPDAIPLRDLVPDYLLVDFPSHLRLTKTMLEYSETRPLHRGREQVSFHNGLFNDKEVTIKRFHQVDTYKRTTLPLSCVRREAGILSSLDHPNIVKVFGFCLNPACILIERAPLGNLYQILMNTAVKVSKTVLFHISSQVASGLSYLHRHSIVYNAPRVREEELLKANSESILVWSMDFNFDASVKLSNFEQSACQTPSGLISKITYCSYPPAKILKHSFTEDKIDVYAFGVFLSELIQPYKRTRLRKPKLSDAVIASNRTMVKLMEECWKEETMIHPSAIDILLQISQPSFQCLVTSQVLRDFVSVCGCCLVPSAQQIWIYGEAAPHGKERLTFDGMQVFILNTENLTVQGSLELKDTVTAMFTISSQVWIRTTEQSIHVYDTTTFRFTHRFRLDGSATIIADNESYVFVGQVNGHIKCYPKLELQREDCQLLNFIDIKVGNTAIEAIVTAGSTVWIGCGNELVMLNTEKEIKMVQKVMACKPSDNISLLTVSHSTGTVWCLTHNSHRITGWDIYTNEQKCNTDLTEHLDYISSELKCESKPSCLMMVSIECVNDTLWVGLSCGVIMILSDAEQPQKIVHFKVHKQAVESLVKIPQNNGLHQEHNYPMILGGGFGEISPLSSTASEQNGVVMLWHAFTANEFSTISKRHTNYHSASID